MAPRRVRGDDAAEVISVTDWYRGKRHCVGCGLERNVKYAEANPCTCCGSYGTQRYMPLLDDDGVAVPAEAAQPVERERKPIVAQKKKETVPAPSLDDLFAGL